MNRSEYFNSWLNIFYILFFISLFLFFAPLENDGKKIFPHSDKVAHFSIFFLMTVLLIVGKLKKNIALIFCIFYVYFVFFDLIFLSFLFLIIVLLVLYIALVLARACCGTSTSTDRLYYQHASYLL